MDRSKGEVRDADQSGQRGSERPEEVREARGRRGKSKRVQTKSQRTVTGANSARGQNSPHQRRVASEEFPTLHAMDSMIRVRWCLGVSCKNTEIVFSCCIRNWSNT